MTDEEFRQAELEEWERDVRSQEEKVWKHHPPKDDWRQVAALKELMISDDVSKRRWHAFLDRLQYECRYRDVSSLYYSRRLIQELLSGLLSKM